MPSWLPRVNRLVVNRIQGTWAPYLPPWAMIVHRGRRSGTEYRTPVLAWKRGSTIKVALFYGDHTDWLLNLLAAGGGGIERGGRLRRLTAPHIETLGTGRLKVLVADTADTD